uniref:Uncharacterized protein n=1 Tax=Heterosigma akashiwo TaxID=2829 RepID=A0A7S3XSJ6_HETAK
MTKKITDTNTTTAMIMTKEAEVPTCDLYCKAAKFILKKTGVACPGKELEKIVTLLDLKEKRIKRWAKKINENETAASYDMEGSDDSQEDNGSDEDEVIVEAVQTEKVNDDCSNDEEIHGHAGPIYEAFVQNGVLLAPDTLHSVLRILKVRPKRICGRGLVRPLGVARRDYRYWNQILPRQIVSLGKRKENNRRGNSKGLKKMMVTPPILFAVVNGRAKAPFQGKHGPGMRGPNKHRGLGKHSPGTHGPGKHGPGEHGKGGPGKHGPGKKHGSDMHGPGKHFDLGKHGRGMHSPGKHGPGKYGPSNKSCLYGPRAHRCVAYVPLVAFGGGAYGRTCFVPHSHGGRVELSHLVVPESA